MTQLPGGVNPAAQKISKKNDFFGIPNANTMQGTSRELYDSLPFENNTTQFNFFREAGSRTFPDTNLAENGNKLPVGDSFGMQGFYLSITKKETIEDPKTEQILVDFIADNKYQHLRTAELDLYVGNSRVIKELPLIGSLSFANRFAQSDKIVYLLDTPIVIPQQVMFYAILRVPNFSIPEDENITERKLRLTLTGMGGLLNLKQPL